MPAGQMQAVTTQTSQILNPTSTVGPTLIENILTPDENFILDLCWSPMFNPAATYKLLPGGTYSWPNDIPLFVRISPGQNADGNSVQVWVQPEGVPQGIYTNSNATLTGIDPSLIPLQVEIVNPSANTLSYPNLGPANRSSQIGREISYVLPVGGKIGLFQATLVAVGTAQLYPHLQITTPSNVPYLINMLTENDILQSETRVFTGMLGFGPPYTENDVTNFAIPDVFLPPGTAIATQTDYLSNEDQWSNFSISMAQ